MSIQPTTVVSETDSSRRERVRGSKVQEMGWSNLARLPFFLPTQAMACTAASSTAACSRVGLRIQKSARV
jgi:hypothetical protein